MSTWGKIKFIGILLAALALGLIPFGANNYILNFLILTFMFCILAQAWNIIGGMTGYISLSTAGFFGIGAYSVGILMSKGGNFFSALAVTLFIVFGAAILIGAGLLKAKGHYFTVASFAFSEFVREIANNTTGLTGGGMGLQVPIYPGTAEERTMFFYYVMAMLMILTITFCKQLSCSKWGYAFKAIREDEDAAEVAGIDTVRYKVLSFVLSSVLTGLAGGIYAYWISFLEPFGVFLLSVSINALIMTLIGGAGTVIGPIIGAFILQIATETAWNYSLELHSAAIGVILVLVVLFMPNGLTNIIKNFWEKRKIKLEDVTLNASERG